MAASAGFHTGMLRGGWNGFHVLVTASTFLDDVKEWPGPFFGAHQLGVRLNFDVDIKRAAVDAKKKKTWRHHQRENPFRGLSPEWWPWTRELGLRTPCDVFLCLEHCRRETNRIRMRPETRRFRPSGSRPPVPRPTLPGSRPTLAWTRPTLMATSPKTHHMFQWISRLFPHNLNLTNHIPDNPP